MLGLNVLTVTLPVLLVQCNSSECRSWEDCVLMVWLCSWLCCYVTEIPRKSVSMLSGLEQSGGCGLLSKCIAEYLFHGLCLQPRWQDRQRQVQAIISHWSYVLAFFVILKMRAWHNSGHRRFEPFAHTTHTFCYDTALLLQEIKYSIVITGNKPGEDKPCPWVL